MILDYNYLFDGSASAAGGVTGTALTSMTAGGLASTNVIDLVNARDMGIGDAPALKIMVLVTTSFSTTGTASTTMQIKAQGSTDNTTFTTYAETAALASGSMTAGLKIAQFDWPGINPDNGALPRYLRLLYVLGGPGSTFSAGSVISAIVLGRDDSRGYPPGVTVSN